MKAIIKLYLKAFLLITINYFTLIMLFGSADDFELILWEKITMSLLIGAFMSIILVSFHWYNLKKDGVKITDDNVGVNQTRTIETKLDKNELIDKLKLDDPVGAIAVHLICGIWGTLAVGIFGDLAGWAQLGSQAIGVVAVGVTCLISAYAIIKTLKSTVGIRVSSQEEQEGLDIHEHGMDAYPDFRLNQH